MSEFIQTIEIENLMGVKKCKISLSQLMILIGEQSTGKSTICKAIYYLRKFPEVLTRHLQRLALEGDSEFPVNVNALLDKDDIDKVIRDVYREHKELFRKIFGVSWDKPDMNMKYRFDTERSLRVYTTQENHFLSVDPSDALYRTIFACVREVWRIYVYEISDSSSMQKSKRQSEINRRIEKMVSKIFKINQNTVYIPAGRSLLTLTSQQGGLKLDSLDYITGEFVNLIGTIRKEFSNGRPSPPEDEQKDYTHQIYTLWDEVATLLKGEYHIVDGQERLSIPLSHERQDLGLNYTSSGQQEMLWVLNSLYLWALERETLFVVIEEPEAHLFPAAQKKIMEIVSRFINLTGSSVLITTHSPYILTAANNLIFADRVSRGVQDTAQVEALVPKIAWVNSDRFAAWYVSGKTYFENIVTEYHEIDAAKIDSISETINRLYGDLYALLPEEDYDE